MKFFRYFINIIFIALFITDSQEQASPDGYGSRKPVSSQPKPSVPQPARGGAGSSSPSGGGVQQPRQPQGSQQGPKSNSQRPSSSRQPTQQQPDQSSQKQPQRNNNFEGTICGSSLCICEKAQINCNKLNLRKYPKEPWPSGAREAVFDQNHISSLESNVFNIKQTENLEKLSIAFNQLKEIKANTFQGLSNLVELVLTGNKISKLDYESFNGLTSLQTLRLGQNKLTEISVDPLLALNSLRRLFLDENELETIDIEFFEQVTSVNSLSLGSNPWKCDCKLLGILIWIYSKNEVKGEAICSKPDAMSGRQLISFSYSDVKTMCSAAWDDDSDSDPEISPEEKIEKQKMNESCSEHTSDEPLDLCYISKDIHTSLGKHVCLHCLGTKKDGPEENGSKEKTAGENDFDAEMDISWKVPSSANNSHDSDRIAVHDNGTLCIESIQVNDVGEYTCTITLKNHTKSDSVYVSVSSLAVQVAIGIVIGVVALLGVISSMFFRWWMKEVDKDSSQIVPMDIQVAKQ